MRRVGLGSEREKEGGVRVSDLGGCLLRSALVHALCACGAHAHWESWGGGGKVNREPGSKNEGVNREGGGWVVLKGERSEEKRREERR